MKWIQFDATTEEAENLLYADFFVWQHSSGAHDVSCEEYHIPSHVQKHVDYVTPGIRLREKRAEQVNMKRNVQDQLKMKPLRVQLPQFPSPNATTCDQFVTAECTRGMHTLPGSLS